MKHSAQDHMYLQNGSPGIKIKLSDFKNHVPSSSLNCPLLKIAY